jgi:fatty-acyl-CoA synthase
VTSPSYESCPGASPLLGSTIGAHLRAVAERHPDNEALVSCHQNVRFTYRDFDTVVDQAAKSFLKLGIEYGDRVAIWSTNNYEWVVAQYATARIGAILVTINPAYRLHEFEYAMKDSRSKLLLLAESFKTSDYVQMTFAVCPEIPVSELGRIKSQRLPDLRIGVVIGRGSYPGIGKDVSDSELQEREQAVQFDDPINIQYTSGTTGFPKGVTLNHHSILNNAYSVAELLDLSEKDRLCVPVPFYHCFGMVLSSLTAVSHAATLVIPSASFDVEATLSAVESERCTVLHGVPTMFIAELEHPGFARHDLASLRTGVMAGAPCPVELMKAVIDKMHLPEILIGYGQTEASPICTMTRREDDLLTRVQTVGRVLPHQELKIVDPGSGRIVDRGEQGEICFRGYQVMIGYDNLPEATDEAIDRARWLHSGDLGRMDERGYVKITGRLKEMVIRGGENIYPREIEEFLHALPVVSDAYVVGVPDLRYGEELCACVRLRDDARTTSSGELRALCEGRIAHFKVPRYWLFMSEFPMTVTGKVQKFRLREMAIDAFGLQEAAQIKTA